MSKRKPDNTSLADQLKPLAQKLETDRAAAVEAEKKAKQRQVEAEAAARKAKEEAISDDERFERAVGGLARKDVVKKFDDSARARREAEQAAGPKKSDEDLFLEAMGRPPPRR